MVHQSHRVGQKKLTWHGRQCRDGIEDENRRMKVAGGIVGITQNKNALDHFFITVPHLSSLVSEFEKSIDWIADRILIDMRHHDVVYT